MGDADLEFLYDGKASVRHRMNRFGDHAAVRAVDGEEAAVDGARLERAQHVLRGMEVGQLVSLLRRSVQVMTRRLLIEAAGAALDADHDPFGDDPVRQQDVEHRVLRAGEPQAHGRRVRVLHLQVDEQLPGIVAHLVGDLVQLARAQRVDVGRCEAEALEGAPDEVRDTLAGGGKLVMLVAAHDHGAESLTLEEASPFAEGVVAHA